MERRDFLVTGLCGGAATAAGLPAGTVYAGEDKPETLPPQPGDLLVLDNEAGDPVLASLLEFEAEQTWAYPRDPNTGLVRRGSRFNKLMVIRLDPEQLDTRTQAASDGSGIVAYSGICTHEGCDVNSWVADKKEFFCFCHYSRFDPYRAGKVTTGPARRRLPMLPIKVVDDQLVVTAEFSSRPGKKSKRTG